MDVSVFPFLMGGLMLLCQRGEPLGDEDARNGEDHGRMEMRRSDGHPSRRSCLATASCSFFTHGTPATTLPQGLYLKNLT